MMLSKSVLYITIKTQVRRLKYFSVSLKCISHEGLQKQMLTELLLNWSKSNHESFENYRSTSGEITLQQGKPTSNSIKAYYHALKEFSLIIEQGNFVLSTKKGEVLIILLQHLQGIRTPKDLNAYSLSISEKSFFFIILLESDYDIILLILQILNTYPNQKLDSYLNHFQSFYLKRLEKKLENAKNLDVAVVLETQKRVSSWRSPKRYSEELVPPRLNWLIDLDLITLNNENGAYNLTIDGNYLLKMIKESEVELNCYIYNENFWSSRSISIISLLYFKESVLRLWEDLTENEKESSSHEALSIAAKYFCVFGIPRMPAKSTILLICLYLLNKHSISANFKEIIEWLSPSRKLNGKVYGYRRAAREGEEYIIITHEQ
jgi:hypothetical protein